MVKRLLLVESPTKVPKLKKILAGEGDWDVVATAGHFRALSPMLSGIFFPDVINTESDFSEKLIQISKPEVAQRIERAVANSDEVFLGTDGDREGESIAWHLIEAFGLSGARRSVFREITKDGVLAGIAHAGSFDSDLADAARARAVLDYLLGMNMSRLLWPFGCKSAGRLQSCALRILVERERAIQNFQAISFWQLKVDYAQGFSASVIAAEVDEESGDEKFLSKRFESKAEALAILEQCRALPHRVEDLEIKPRLLQPPKPLTTSSLLAAASTKLKLPVEKTTQLAQQLFEAGVITYIRTDSTTISTEAREMIRAFIAKENPELVPESARTLSNEKGAQAAHEAIRPTQMEQKPEGLSSEQQKLYALIFEHSILSQCKAAKLSSTTAIIQVGDCPWKLQARATMVIDAGWLTLARENEKGETLPPLNTGDTLQLENAGVTEGRTKAPARFNEVTLIKRLEKKNIGRPSTYASMISTLRDRAYIASSGKYLVPETTGFRAEELVRLGFDELSQEEFTAKTERALDGIAAGKISRALFLKKFYQKFCGLEKTARIRFDNYAATNPELMSAAKNAHLEEASAPCPMCSKTVVAQPYRDKEKGSSKRFWRCTDDGCSWKSNFPPPEVCESPCPKCQGKLLERKPKSGETFWGCARYPECDGILTGKKTRKRPKSRKSKSA